MLYHPGIARLITEKDRTILMHLQDVSHNLHTQQQGYGFDLLFRFEKNDYFSNEEPLKKSFVMSKQNVVDACEGSAI